MEQSEKPIVFDLPSFAICQNCLRFVFILIAEGYVGFLCVRVVLNL
jgi:hypothetical protein